MYDSLNLFGDELLFNVSARVPFSAEVRISLWAYVAIRHIQRSDITRPLTLDLESHAIGGPWTGVRVNIRAKFWRC